MPNLFAQQGSSDLVELMRIERQAFAAKIRMTRALIGWSQTELAHRVGLTQRSVHKLEQGDTEPRRTTVRVIEELWREQGVVFEDLPDGGFHLRARPALFDHGTSHARAGVQQRANTSSDH